MVKYYSSCLYSLLFKLGRSLFASNILFIYLFISMVQGQSDSSSTQVIYKFINSTNKCHIT